MLKVIWLCDTVIVCTVGKSSPHFALGVTDGEQLRHVRWPVASQFIYYGRYHQSEKGSCWLTARSRLAVRSEKV